MMSPQYSQTNITASQVSITNSANSQNISEIKQDLKDVHGKRLLLNVSEAASLHPVTVKLMVDYAKFLDLQRKLPESYA